VAKNSGRIQKLKIEKEILDTSEAKLTVEVDASQMDEARKRAARKLAQRYAIPGFRKGKAPYEIVLRHLGEGAITEAALEDIVDVIYPQVIDQSGVDAIGPGQLADAKMDPPVFTFMVPLRPEVDISNYRDVRLGYNEAAVTEEALTDYLEHLREHEAVLEPVEREAQMKDVVTVDVAGKVLIPATPAPAGAPELVEGAETPAEKPEGEAATEPEASAESETPAPVAEPVEAPVATEATEEFLMDDKDVEVLLAPDLTWPAPGFGEKLVGIKPDEERSFDLAFPDDYANDSLKGKLAHYDVKCKGVKSRALPEWDDELAKTLGYESIADMRTKAQDTLEQQGKTRLNDEYTQSVVDIVVAGSTVKYPPYLYDREIEELTQDLDRRLREQNLTLEDYKKVTGRTDEQIAEELAPSARERLRRSLVLGKVIELEGLTVEEQDITDRIEMVAPLFGKDADKYRKMMKGADARRSVRYDLLSDKAVKQLVAIAKGENPPQLAASLEVLSEANEVPFSTPESTEVTEGGSEAKPD
jgi:trigger factor